MQIWIYFRLIPQLTIPEYKILQGKEKLLADPCKQNAFHRQGPARNRCFPCNILYSLSTRVENGWWLISKTRRISSSLKNWPGMQARSISWYFWPYQKLTFKNEKFINQVLQFIFNNCHRIKNINIKIISIQKPNFEFLKLH